LLSETGQPGAARREHEKALAIFQKLADAHPTVTQHLSDLAISRNNLGTVLMAAGQPAEARRTYEQALTIRRKLAREHPEAPGYASDVGAALNNIAWIDLADHRFVEARDQLRQAIDWQKKALAANPRNPTYRQFLARHLGNLVHAARSLGRKDEAAAALRELAELNASDPRFADLDARLAGVLNGQTAKDNTERLALAKRAYDTKRHASAAKLWAEALDADSKLATDRRAQHRYNAACAAALAAVGQGKDSPPPDEAAKTNLRQQSRDWLQAELAAWKKVLESARPEQRAVVIQTLRHWQEDPDLAGVRDPDALARLPESARAAWQSLWAEAAALIDKAGNAGP
jgi:tetratricopeptide (TPR) repeat protein